MAFPFMLILGALAQMYAAKQSADASNVARLTGAGRQPLSPLPTPNADIAKAGVASQRDTTQSPMPTPVTPGGTSPMGAVLSQPPESVAQKQQSTADIAPQVVGQAPSALKSQDSMVAPPTSNIGAGKNGPAAGGGLGFNDYLNMLNTGATLTGTAAQAAQDAAPPAPSAHSGGPSIPGYKPVSTSYMAEPRPRQNNLAALLSLLRG